MPASADRSSRFPLLPAAMIVLLLGGSWFAFARWKATSQSSGAAPTESAPGAPSAAPAIDPLTFGDLTQMLRAGKRDDEIIAAIAGKQLVSRIGHDEAARLRELGAGDRLVTHLLNRRLYALPPGQ